MPLREKADKEERPKSIAFSPEEPPDTRPHKTRDTDLKFGALSKKEE
jgi:hypothetical protein